MAFEAAPPKPIIYIDHLAKAKLDLYIDGCSDEISGFGNITRHGRKFLITDLFLIKQECTSSSSDLDEKALDAFMVDLVEQEKSPEDIKLWWHSHVNMGTFWSGTDTDTIDKFKNGWFISIVGNKSGAYRTRLDLFDPIRYWIDEVRLETIFPATASMKESIDAEIKEKVTKKVYGYQQHGTSWGEFYPKQTYNRELGCWERHVKEWDMVTKEWVVRKTRVVFGGREAAEEEGYGMGV